MTPELETAISRTKELFHDRDTAEDWGRNIIEGSEGLETQRDWTLYYSFLNNPTEFDENLELSVLNPNEVIPPLRDDLCTEVVKNGTVTHILIKRKTDDEKVEE